MHISADQLWRAAHGALVRLARWLGFKGCMCESDECREKIIAYTARAMAKPEHPVERRWREQSIRNSLRRLEKGRPPAPDRAALVACPPCPACGSWAGWLVDVSRLECAVCGHKWRGRHEELRDAGDAERAEKRRVGGRQMAHEVEE